MQRRFPSTSFAPFFLGATVAWCFCPGRLAVSDEPAASPKSIAITDPVPYGQSPVDYLGSDANDAVARLTQRLRDGKAALDWQEPQGYLRSLLKELDVPVESQVLVFSKTALNPALVTPKNPRAVFFNDDVCVGWVPGADAIEVTAVDPHKGAIFYLLPQDRTRAPALSREHRCLACHAGNTTLNVPGLIVRSFLTDDLGGPTAGYSRITHDSPFDQRFGGWYVTGTHGEEPHCGNLFGPDARERRRDSPLSAGNAEDLKGYLDVGKYPSPHSDLVAHLVLQHQAHGLNLIARVGHEARLNRRSNAEEQLLRYLLFTDEPPLRFPVKGTSGFAEAFARRAGTESGGPSLRTLNLKTRLFEHRLSYLIESPLFDGLPAEVRGRLYERLWQMLAEGSDAAESKHIPNEERAEIVAFVRRIKTDLPEVWKAGTRSDR